MQNSWAQFSTGKNIFLDGSTGTMLQKYGMPGGVAPEIFCLEHPDIIRRIQNEYLAAGSDVILSPTFGANRIKLKNYALEGRVAELNRELAEATSQLAHQHGKLAAGDIGPTGAFFEPFGETGFEIGIEIFAEQIRALEAAGVDVLLIETQIDIQEARIALLAAKENSRLPVLVSMTFDESRRTLTGSDPVTCLNILQALGADGFGINCSTGPDKMLAVVAELTAAARIPIFVKPNAGLPSMQNNQTVFPMDAAEFASYAPAFKDLGISMLGGCCGTTPGHIAALKQAMGTQPGKARSGNNRQLLLSSPRKTIAAHPAFAEPLRLVGERINPTGKAKLQAELKAGNLDLLKQFAYEQKAGGADLLDVNVGMPGIDEKATMRRAVSELAVASDLPLCLDSSKPEVIAAALRVYPGRALINSLSGEHEKLQALLPLIKKYGAAYIVLPVDDQGIPETVLERKEVLRKILEECARQGVPQEHAVVDGLAMTVSSNQAAARVTLDMLAYTSRELGLNTILGLSNVSFGLPGREQVNNAFLSMAAAAGLSMVIANPGAASLLQVKLSADVLTGRDPNSKNFIQHSAAQQPPNVSTVAIKAEMTPQLAIAECIDRGEKERIEKLLQAELDQGTQALALVQNIMVPAIQAVGDKFNRREYFLPQLIASAETMEKGVQYLTPYLRDQPQKIKGIGVMATVKGDIHDIGKKIVALLLRNHGYEIIDLGKSVDEETIIKQALQHRADFIGLSALMTTTMTEMKKIIDLVKIRKLPLRVIVGGAVVTQKYADEIGADGFAVDAGQSVVVLNRLFEPK